ncbi:uncharacterized protein LOC141685909 [Apium graveolens]|uniref:uncharacterized protein LOC141685909 n=1 Tax=Apium graveolens TaxID=4045 RepID=UPI003D7BB168
MSCFYGYPERAKRRDSWSLIRRLSGLDSLPWLIMGDFNDLMYESDKQGNVPHPNYLLNGFRETITDRHLSEIDLCGGNFTWEKSRGSTNWVGEKLDRGFASSSWWTKFPLCNLRVIQTSHSDHDPINLVLLKVDISKQKFQFRFENMWLKESSFVAEVTEAWKNIPAYHLLPKLIEVSSFMDKWGRKFFHKFREKVKEQKRIMDDLVDRLDDDSMQAYRTAKGNLNDLLYQEEAYWKQRAKMFWLTEGDENTMFFHSSASARKKLNHIDHLFDNNGVCIKDQEGMADIIFNHFSNLFTGVMAEDDFEHMECPRQVTDEHNAQLVEDLTFGEFTLAVK